MAVCYPYFFCDDARVQSKFYSYALDGDIVSVQTFEDAPDMPNEIKDKVMHLVLKAKGQHFFMADRIEGETISGNQMDLTLEFKDEKEARQVFSRLSEEGRVFMPFEKMFWGAMFGRLEDRFGVRWQIVTEH
ncbi:VOC family protein [Pontibacillus salipaludis]|uniref:VOC family protein n=1 Tax=Pontibacillus salipaludis TaxID=1697394 RepID=UPI0031F1C097